MTILIVVSVLGLFLNILGLTGCFIPVLPGPTLNLLSLFLLYFFITPSPFTLVQLSIFTVLVLVVLIIDNFLPILAAKAYGSSIKGTIGATVGLLIGVFFFPPVGMILGAFIGAYLGEIISRKDQKLALKAGFATTLGFITGMGVKLSVSGVMAFYFIKALLIEVFDHGI